MNSAEYIQALPYFEKALEYNPNSAEVIRFLSEFYASYMPDTEKYLEYALKGVQLDIASHDSITASYIYLHLSNAFIQSGFVDDAEKHINKSLTYSRENLFSQYVKAYILYAKNEDLEQTRDLLVATLAKDTTRLDVLQEVAKIYYYERDYQNAYKYYKKFTNIKESQQLDIYPSEDAKIAVVFANVGLKTESDSYFDTYLNYANNDKSIYKNLSLAMYYAYNGNTEKTLEQMKLFARQDNYMYWALLFLKIDPLIDHVKDNPEFQQLLREIETKFWINHQRIKVSLEEKGLL